MGLDFETEINAPADSHPATEPQEGDWDLQTAFREKVEEAPETPKEPPETPEEATTDEKAPPEAEKAPESDSEGEPGTPGPKTDETPEKGPAGPLSGDLLKTPIPIQVDGKEEKIPLGDLIEAGKTAQSLTETARKRLQEAAHYNKSAKRVIELVMENPVETAIQLLTGANKGDAEAARAQVFELVRPFVVDVLNELAMDEKERESTRQRREEERKRKDLEEEYRALKAKEEARTQAEMQKAMDLEITQAIESAGLPKTAQVLNLMAREIYAHADAGIDLSAADAAERIKALLKPPEPNLKDLKPEEIYEKHPEFIQALAEVAKKRAQEGNARSSNRTATAKRPAESAGVSSNPSRRRDGARKYEKWNDFFDPDRRST